jgi:hypothetical protein
VVCGACQVGNTLRVRSAQADPDTLARTCTLQWQSVTVRIADNGKVEKHRVDIPAAHGAYYTVSEGVLGFSLQVLVGMDQAEGGWFRGTSPVTEQVQQEDQGGLHHRRVRITAKHSMVLQHVGT